MKDYNKLTVVEIRAIFKERGIPATGLTRKQQLIDRLLVEDQGETSSKYGFGKDGTYPEPAAPSDNTQTQQAVEHKQVPTKQDEVALEAVPEEQPPHPVPSERVPGQAPVVQSREQPTDTIQSTAENPNETRILSPMESSGGEESRKRKRRSLTPPVSSRDIARKRYKDEEAGAVHLEGDMMPEQEPNLVLQTSEDDVAEAKVESTKGDGSTEEIAIVDVAQGDVTKMEDIQADQSQEDGLQEGNPQSDETMKSAAKQAQDVKEPIEEPLLDTEASKPESTMKDIIEPQQSLQPDPTTDEQEMSMGNATDPTPTSSAQNSTNSASIRPNDTSIPTLDDRPVSPSLHQATSALYIRDLMRPLQPNTLQSHLTALAQHPSGSPSHPASNLLTFHLDSIRTHCFAIFDSLAATARVRAALHEQVWPAERTRKPLWVDYVPEEKVQGWIETELNAGDGGRSTTGGPKRWEVVYQRSDAEDGGMTVSLQEVGTSIAGIAGPIPSGPRRRSLQPTVPVTAPFPPPEVVRETSTTTAPPAQSKPQQQQQPSSGFSALDSLFKSTTAKPKLYFLPVKPEVARRRLDELAAKTRTGWDTGGGEVGEMNRYTFESVGAGSDGEVAGEGLVDNGPEFGMRKAGRRGGGGARGGGGGGGGYGGGGAVYGGYRGGRGRGGGVGYSGGYPRGGRR